MLASTVRDALAILLVAILRPSNFCAFVCCFYSFILIIPDAASVFAAILVALSSLVLLLVRPIKFFLQDRLFGLCLLLYPLSLGFSLLIKGGDWDYIDYPVRVLLFVPLILGLRGLAQATSFSRFMYLGCNMGGVCSAIFSIKSLLIDNVDRVGLPITSSIAYGQIAAILGLVSFVSIFQAGDLSHRLFPFAGFLGAAFAINASSSLGALMGFAGGMVVLVILLMRDKFVFPYNIILLLILSSLGIVIAPLLLKDLPTVYSDVLSPPASYMYRSQGHRLLLWGIAVKQIFDSPFIGIGPGNFVDVINQYCQENFCVSDFSGYRGVHNQFLDSAMNGGLIGFFGLMFSYLGPLILFVRRISRKAFSSISSNAAMAGVAVIIAGMISGFSQVLYGHQISIISYLLTITFLWYLADQPQLRAVELVESHPLTKQLAKLVPPK